MIQLLMYIVTALIFLIACHFLPDSMYYKYFFRLFISELIALIIIIICVGLLILGWY